MSAGAISLESALRTCKVNPGWANRLESNRIIGPAAEKTCPMWNGFDLAGRAVCPDSFNTKTAGCHSALDRLYVENEVSRPQYIPYVNLSMEGLKGDHLYGQKNSHYGQHPHREAVFGQQMSSHVKFGGLCTYDSYQQSLAESNHRERTCQNGVLHSNNSSYRELGGYY